MLRPSLKKRLGQHHLRSGGTCAPLVRFLAPAGRRVLEVGPGGGVLTRELLAAGARVWAWEVDLDWAMHLRSRRLVGDLGLVAADALTLPWRRLRPGTRVTGNLPYGIATELIRLVLAAFPAVDRAAFLVQSEVAQRLLARPGESGYGALTVLTAARARVRRLGRVKRTAFVPPPRVDGTFLGLELRPAPLAVEEMVALERVVRLAFSLRRKTLRNSLASSWGRDLADRVLADLGWEGEKRAEELDLEAFIRLYRAAAVRGIGGLGEC